MNKDAILTFIKKNMTSLICGVLALLAIGLTFYPIGDWITALQGEADDRARLHQSLTSAIKERTLPLSDPQAEPGKLTGLPNTETIKEAKEATEKFKTTSERMVKLISDLSQQNHTQLVPNELPVETLQTTALDFAACYKQVLSTDPTVSIATDPTLMKFAAKNIQNDILNGALPPTTAEIEAAGKAIWDNNYVPMIIYQNGKAINMTELGDKFKAERAKLPQKMQGEVATKHKCYVDHDAFTVNPLISPNQPSPIADIWYAQMQLWIQLDLAAGISEANSNSANILDAQVKRVIAMQIPAPAAMYVYPPATATGGAGGQTGVGGVPSTADEKTSIPPIYTISSTGRYSNGMYDVVTFRLVVDVDSSKVNQFIQMLQRNRLITITNESVFALDYEYESADPRNYLYGNGSSVRLVLDGEELFMRDWIAKVIPPVVLTKAGAPGAPGAPGPGPMGMPGGGQNFTPGGMPPHP